MPSCRRRGPSAGATRFSTKSEQAGARSRLGISLSGSNPAKSKLHSHSLLRAEETGGLTNYSVYKEPISSNRAGEKGEYPAKKCSSGEGRR